MPSHPRAPHLTASVVIPVRDDAVALERCLLALRSQTAGPLEVVVVVVDNGSQDGSARTASRLGARVVLEQEHGIAAAASRGYDEAVGDLILRLDADCVPREDWIERLVDAFRADRGLDALTGPGEFVALPRPVRRIAELGYMGLYFRGVGALIGCPPLFGSNLGMRREAWQRVSAEVHRHDLQVHDDLDLTIHLARDHRLVLDPRLTIEASARPLGHPFGMLERLRRAVHTLRLHPRPERPTERRTPSP